MVPKAGDSTGKKGLSRESGHKQRDKRQIESRRNTILRKAQELCILCDCKICVIITDKGGNVETWARESDDVLQLIEDYQNIKHSARKSSVPRKKSSGGRKKANLEAGNHQTGLMIELEPQIQTLGFSPSSSPSCGAAMADEKSEARPEYYSGHALGVTNGAYQDSACEKYGQETRFFGGVGNINETLAMIEYEAPQVQEVPTPYSPTMFDEAQGFLSNDELNVGDDEFGEENNAWMNWSAGCRCQAQLNPISSTYFKARQHSY